MTMSYSYTASETFTLTDARRLAARVAADMHQCQRLYGHLTDAEIENYLQELTILLHGGYVKSYEFGFKTSDKQRVLSWFYTVGPSGNLEGGRSGGLFPSANISGAVMFNFLSYNSEWSALSNVERDKIKASYPVRRTEGSAPQDGNGYWDSSRHYTSGGVAVTRKEFRPW
jgi:Bacterial HORMA domain family 1